MKTAGTSLRLMLEHEFGEDDLFPSERDLAELPHGWYPTTEQLLDDASRLEQRVVIGHYPASVAAELPGRRDVVTVLRDPVERTVSMMRHRHRGDVSGRSVEHLLDDSHFVEAQLRDYQTKVLGMPPGEVNHPYETDDRTLEAALDTVASAAVVGVAERFDRFCRDFDSTYGTALVGALRRDNTSPAFAISPELRARIEPLVRRDLELYRAASARADRCAPRG